MTSPRRSPRATKALLLALAACALAVPAPVRAQLVLGADAGLAIPVGSRDAGVKLSGEVARAFPLELSAGWRIAPALTVGLQGGYAFAGEGDARSASCAATGVDCAAHLWRLGARAEYGFDGREWLPFAAATLGWEWLIERWKLSAGNWDQSTRGGWTLGIEGGVERHLSGRFRGGAFVSAGLGQYVVVWEKGETIGISHHDSAAIDGKGAHGWFGIGLRVTFEP